MGRLKRDFLIEHGYDKAQAFVETGTRHGISLARVADLYPEVHGIEIVPEHHHAACQRLARFQHVTVHLGDSAQLLPHVLNPSKRTVCWLDAHADGVADDMPPDPEIILRELGAILSLSWKAPLAILIDDAEKFGERFWRMEASHRHHRAYWLKESQIVGFLKDFGYKTRVIRRTTGNVWAIEREWK